MNTHFNNFILLLILLGSICQSALGNDSISDPAKNLKLANEAYSRGAFDSAAYLYETIMKAGFESTAIYYNAGNSYYKMKNIPYSILYFEKAKKLDPEDADNNFNLQMANQQIIDKVEPLPEFIITKWWKQLISSSPADSWGTWFLVFIYYSMAMLTFFVFSPSSFWKRVLFSSGIIGIILACFCFTFGSIQKERTSENIEAIVFTPSITTKSSPDENSTNLFVIHEGSKVRIMETVNEWCKISLPDGNIGWMRSEELKQI